MLMALLAPTAQPTGTILVRVRSEDRPVRDASVRCGTVRVRTDPSGTAVLNLPTGLRAFIVEKPGYAPDTLVVEVRPGRTEAVAVLRESVLQLSEMVVTSTRAERRVADDPTRVEVTGREDIEEQTAASPGSVAELLTEVSGVRIVPASPGAGGASVRIRGLSGRYTKFLSDGLPLFGLGANGLAPLQVPPLDLERVEVIKGVASALYGPTALGGVVNLVSQRAGATRQLLLNRTSRGGTDVALWDARALGPGWGSTLLASANFQGARDLDGDGWAEIASHPRVVLRPRIFWGDSTGSSWFFTAGLTAEDRKGGTLDGKSLPGGSAFAEGLDSRRTDVGSVLRRVLGAGTVLSLRGSATEEWRTHQFGGTRERDRRSTAFGEAALTSRLGSSTLVTGASVERDAYHAMDVARMDYNHLTPSVFAEHLWLPAGWLHLSSSLRWDHPGQYGGFVSPRFSALLHPGPSWNVRVALGNGVFTPTPFTEETEVIGLSHLRPLAGLRPERATGVSLDLGGELGRLEVQASAFSTSIEYPLALRAVPESIPLVRLVNAGEATRVGGIELFARLRMEPLTITGSYDFLDGSELDVERGVRREIPLNPRHSGGITVIWEEEDDTRIGVEAYYTGRAALSDNTYRSTSVPFLFVDALVQQRLGPVVVFLHGEDLNDVRQTDHDPLLRTAPGLGGRWTTEVWAPMEGRVINIGLKWMY